MDWKILAQSRAADAQSRAADAQSRAADVQMLTSYLGFVTLLIASLCFVKLDRDIVKLEMEQAARDSAYKAEQASRDLAAAAALNVTVLLLAR